MNHHHSRKTDFRLPSIALIAALLSGCAQLRTEQSLKPVTVPQAWSQTITEAASDRESADRESSMHGSPKHGSLTQWWHVFNDTTLTEIIERALQANPSLHKAQASLRQARAVEREAVAGFFPNVDGSVSTQRSKIGSAASTQTFKAGFDASWELDIFGGTRSQVRAASADVRASEAALGDVQVSIAAEVANSYVQLRGAQVRLRIARDNLVSQSETLQIAQWRVQAGLATSLESEQARAASEQTRAKIPALEASIAQYEHVLAVLTGQVPGATRFATNEPSIPVAPDELAMTMPAETLRQRADVRASEYQLAAAAARVSQAKAARWPSFNLSGALGLSATSFGDLTGDATRTRSLLGSIGVPIFHAGALSARVDAQRAAYDQAVANYESAVLAALQDVEDALANLRGNREQMISLRNAADAASNAALLAQQRYSSGLVDFQTVLETQRTLLSTQDSVAGIVTSTTLNYIQLYKALGGGWQPIDSAQSK